jgi:hypothetical protein
VVIRKGMVLMELKDFIKKDYWDKKRILNVIQKVCFVLLLLSAIACFIYSLGFSSNWANFGEIGDSPVLQIEAQKVNESLFTLSLWTVIFCVLAVLFGAYKHNKYYTYNYVLILISFVLFIILLIVMFDGVTNIKEIYIRDVPIFDESITDFQQLTPYEKKWFMYFFNSNTTYSLSVFTYGYVIASISLFSLLSTITYVTYIFIKNKDYKQFVNLYKKITKKGLKNEENIRN